MMSEVSDLDKTLHERRKLYGDFVGHADIAQALKARMRASGRWHNLRPEYKEALEMIAHKIGRILNGDPNYADSWHDIAGYAKLIEDRIRDPKAGNCL
jgi:hypothetical protein